MVAAKPLSDLDQRVATARDLLRSTVAEYGRVTYANLYGDRKSVV